MAKTSSPIALLSFASFTLYSAKNAPCGISNRLREFKRNQHAVNLFELAVLSPEGVTVVRNQKRRDAAGRGVEVKVGGIPF